MAVHKNSQLKFVILGDGTTGKTSIASRISQNNFTKNYDQTLGVDFFPLKGMELPGRWIIHPHTISHQRLFMYVFLYRRCPGGYTGMGYRRADGWWKDAGQLRLQCSCMVQCLELINLNNIKYPDMILIECRQFYLSTISLITQVLKTWRTGWRKWTESVPSHCRTWHWWPIRVSWLVTWLP